MVTGVKQNGSSSVYAVGWVSGVVVRWLAQKPASGEALSLQHLEFQSTLIQCRNTILECCCLYWHGFAVFSLCPRKIRYGISYGGN